MVFQVLFFGLFFRVCAPLLMPLRWSRRARLRLGLTLGKARRKSSVPACLCRAATADYFLITDANMALTPAWVHTLLVAAATPGIGIVTGPTTASGSLFGQAVARGWQCRNLRAPDALGVSVPQPAMCHLLRQRWAEA